MISFDFQESAWKKELGVSYPLAKWQSEGAESLKISYNLEKEKLYGDKSNTHPLGSYKNLRKQSSPALSPRGCVHSERYLEEVPFSNFHEGGLAHGPGLEQWMTDPHVPGKKTRARSEDAPLQEPPLPHP